MSTRLSKLFVRTLREDPVDAEVASHRLLVRAGYIRRQAPGIFAWLPLGLRVKNKVEAIVREAGIDLDLMHARAVERAIEPLNALQVDAALMIHEEGRSAPETQAFLVRWGLVDEELASHAIRFVQAPASRSYSVCYPAGLERCRAYVAGDISRFRRLLTEQVRVQDLVPPIL